MRDQRRDEREQMVREQIVARGISDSRVLDALRRVPRHLFLPPSLAARAYDDIALPVNCGQTVSQPFIVAYMTQMVLAGAPKSILEIGTGTGYQTAILAELVNSVFTIEWHLALMTSAAERLRELGFQNIQFRCGDGTLGWPEESPFDAILVTAGGPRAPRRLLQQLAVGGVLIAPIGKKDEQRIFRIQRTQRGYEHSSAIDCRFVPLRGAEEWPDLD